MLFKDSERMAFLLLQMTERFRLTDDDASDEELRRIQKNAQELRTSRQRFQAAVKWLVSSPKETKPAAATKEAEEIVCIGENRSRSFPTHRQEKRGICQILRRPWFETPPNQSDSPRLFIPSTSRYHHLVDLFCAFLLNECAGKALSEMPFKVCGQCERLIFAATLGGGILFRQVSPRKILDARKTSGLYVRVQAGGIY